MTDSLDARVLRFVRGARLASASEIARALGVPRSEVNSALYRKIGAEYKITEGQPPRWSLLSAAEGASRQAVDLPKFQAARDFHVDFAGGDWTVRIVIGSDVSRNDPVARVENLGVRRRLITVAQYACGSTEEGGLPPAAVAIASGVLAWEIHGALRDRGVQAFKFEEAMRDIFLSLTWQAQQTTSDG